MTVLSGMLEDNQRLHYKAHVVKFIPDQLNKLFKWSNQDGGCSHLYLEMSSRIWITRFKLTIWSLLQSEVLLITNLIVMFY